MTRRAVLVTLTVAVWLGIASAEQPAEFSFALTGDSIITRKLSVYGEPAFMRIVNLIRGADVAFTNLEMPFHDYEPYAMNQSGGTYMRAEPALVKELVWAGFDMVSRANNHSGDYGKEALVDGRAQVEAAGILAVGAGEDARQAARPAVVELNGWKVAVVGFGKPTGSLSWEKTSVEVARARAEREGRPLLVDFTAAWCGACKELDKHTFAAKDVSSEASRFVAVKVDATVDDLRSTISGRTGDRDRPKIGDRRPVTEDR